MKNYVALGSRPWSHKIFPTLEKIDGSWLFVDSSKEFSVTQIREADPDLVFVLHWSEILPPELFNEYECIGFHMTDLPYGRGGSPLQNLIVRGHASTKLTAFRINEGVDAGPVYMKRDLKLDGSAEEIYQRMSELEAEMIEELISHRPEPVPQQGEPVIFSRRTPGQSNLSMATSSQQAYDLIRMLDAPGYPKAFLDVGVLRLTFDRATVDEEGTVSARVTIEGDR